MKNDFPKLMTRAQAIRSKENGIKINDKFLSNTDFTGLLGSYFPALLNLRNKLKFARFFMEKIIGIHRKRDLPNFQSETFSKWIGSHKKDVKSPIDKVVIFALGLLNPKFVILNSYFDGTTYRRRNSWRLLKSADQPHPGPHHGQAW